MANRQGRRLASAIGQSVFQRSQATAVDTNLTCGYSYGRPLADVPSVTDENLGEDWRAHVGEEPETAGLSTDHARAHERGRGRQADTPEKIPA